MVLEHLIPESWLEQKYRYAFFLGLAYSVIGIILAKLLFPKNTGIVSVIFVALLLSPSLRKIFAMEEQSEEQTPFTMRKLYNLHSDLFIMYFLVFTAIFIAYIGFSFILPQFGVNTINILQEQLFLDPSLRGNASFSFATFGAIFVNNWWVLLATFLLALILGDGAIFFITWNASAWGAIFGFRALAAAQYAGDSGLFTLLTLLFFVVWHVILEGGSYILAGIAGSLISHRIVKSTEEIKEFVAWLILGSVLLILAKWVMGAIGFGTATRFIIYVILTVAILHFLGRIVREGQHAEVFNYTKMVFAIAIGVFVVGGLVETLVLSSSQTLTQIYTLAFCAPNNVPWEECIHFLELAG